MGTILITHHSSRITLPLDTMRILAHIGAHILYSTFQAYQLYPVVDAYVGKGAEK